MSNMQADKGCMISQHSVFAASTLCRLLQAGFWPARRPRGGPVHEPLPARAAAVRGRLDLPAVAPRHRQPGAAVCVAAGRGHVHRRCVGQAAGLHASLGLMVLWSSQAEQGQWRSAELGNVAWRKQSTQPLLPLSCCRSCLESQPAWTAVPGNSSRHAAGAPCPAASDVCALVPWLLMRCTASTLTLPAPVAEG